MPGYVYPYP
jgi:hypothetical protein